LSYSQVAEEPLILKKVNNGLVKLSYKTLLYCFCNYLSVIEEEIAKSSDFLNTLNSNMTSAKTHSIKDTMSISPVSKLKNHNVINKINKQTMCETIHLTFLNLAENFLQKENDHNKFNALFFKEDLVYKTEEEDEETKKYHMKSKKKVVSETVKFQVKQILKFDNEAEIKKYNEWSGNEIFLGVEKIEDKYDYDILIVKLQDFQVKIWHQNL